jgi:alpha-1,6-mannosyltransferase
VQETFGLVSLESQACGTPVVGIRGSAMDRIILHDQEFWAMQHTPDALATAIERASGVDLMSLGAGAAAKIAERYAWPRVFERLFGIYREVCDSHRDAIAG